MLLLLYFFLLLFFYYTIYNKTDELFAGAADFRDDRQRPDRQRFFSGFFLRTTTVHMRLGWPSRCSMPQRHCGECLASPGEGGGHDTATHSSSTEPRDKQPRITWWRYRDADFAKACQMIDEIEWDGLLKMMLIVLPSTGATSLWKSCLLAFQNNP